VDFKQELKNLVERVEGAQGAILVDSSGERVDSYAREGALGLEWLGARYCIPLKETIKINESLEAGEVQELILEQDKGPLLIAPVYAGFFVLLLLAPSGNLGQGRFELKKAAFHLDRDLRGLPDVRK
jgi:predicted regulator of Ras-like GTPase activity (Roadblock/LC7/MglB family)